MSSEARADALEHYMIAQLDKPSAPSAQPPAVRRGAGALFGGPSPSGQRPELAALATMPERPALTDFIRFRGTPGIGNHILQSANDALRKGESEETVLACLLHDYVLNLMKPDHGWWGAQMMEPYVSEKVSWAIRHHQALRFYPDSSVGYEYPELYVRIFGKDYVPAPYIKASYEYARKHKWYMEARMITVHDLYALEPGMKVASDPFVVIGIAKASLADVASGKFIGTTTVGERDGALVALEVHIFPENMRGTGEGHYDWDLRPNSKMTNANVANVTSMGKDRVLTVQYK